jgi:hypothetical protein
MGNPIQSIQLNQETNMNITHAKQAIELRILKGKPEPARTPKELPLQKIKRVQDLFQQRMSEDGEPTKAKHVEGLVKALRNNKGKPLDPLTVFWGGDSWLLLDGHHRHKAYTEHGYNKPVPVEIFRGTLDEAIGASLGSNSKDKLPMSRVEKSNAAWRIVVSTGLSINRTSELSGRSRQAIVTMRNVAKRIGANTAEGYLGSLTWKQAKRVDEKKDGTGKSAEDWIEVEAKVIAKKLGAVFGITLGSKPEAFWKGLALHNPWLLETYHEYNSVEDDDESEEEDGEDEPDARETKDSCFQQNVLDNAWDNLQPSAPM